MSTDKQSSPVYIQEAKFIEQEEDIDPEQWPRHIELYASTHNWCERVDRLEGIISEHKAEGVVSTGHIYNSMSNTATFVEPHFGVAIYVVVSASLKQDADGYPTDPGVFDYNYRLVTLWAYVYDKSVADVSPFWSEDDIAAINQLCKEESGQSEISKYDV